MRSLPTLYKKTSTGAIEQWQISVCGNAIQITHGLVGGKLQTTTDTVRGGKNLGKRNETTAEQQAELEAISRWKKQKERKGYVEQLERAQSGETDAEGGIIPMLAHKFSEHGHKITYPCFAQPKLDGSRCIATIKNGVCTLWSRTRKQITGLPHIVAVLEKRFPTDTILDGELYNHAYHNRFEELMSFVRSDEPKEGHEVIEYHVYDYPSCSGSFSTRRLALAGAVTEDTKALVVVKTIEVANEDELMEAFDHFRRDGYEGVMVRNANSPYIGKRSYDLQKVKEFDDDEFRVVGIEEGRGKLQGHVGAFVCVTKDGVQFRAKAKGETAKLREYFLDESLWKNKLLTVQYQGLTGKNGVPRFPIGVRFREEA